MFCGAWHGGATAGEGCPAARHVPARCRYERMIGERDSQLKRVGRALEARDRALEDARLALAALRRQPSPAPAPGTPGGRTRRAPAAPPTAAAAAPAVLQGSPALLSGTSPTVIPCDTVSQSCCLREPPWSGRLRAGRRWWYAVVPSEAAAELQQLREAEAAASTELQGARAAAQEAQQAAAAASREAAAHRGRCAESQGKCEQLQAQVRAPACTPRRRPPTAVLDPGPAVQRTATPAVEC